MTWHGLFLGHADEARERRLAIQKKFVGAYVAAGQPRDMAVFSMRDSEDGEPDITLYFSPGAVAFARTVAGAAPCAAPRREDLSLDVGDSGCWDVLFSGQGEAQTPG